MRTPAHDSGPPQPAARHCCRTQHQTPVGARGRKPLLAHHAQAPPCWGDKTQASAAACWPSAAAAAAPAGAATTSATSCFRALSGDLLEGRGMGAAVAAATATAAAALASGLGPPELPNPPPASGDLFRRQLPSPPPPPPPPRWPLLLLLGPPQPPALSWLAARPPGLPPRSGGPLPSRCWYALLELLLRCRLLRCTGAPMGDTGTGELPYGRRCITGWVMAEVTTGWYTLLGPAWCMVG